MIEAGRIQTVNIDGYDMLGLGMTARHVFTAMLNHAIGE